MVWFVQTLEKKGLNGSGAGLWHLTAESDEDGGFHVGCDHNHATALEAQNCTEARKKIDQITGMPSSANTDLKKALDGAEGSDFGWKKPLKEELMQKLHAGISRRDWHEVEIAANRLRDET